MRKTTLIALVLAVCVLGVAAAAVSAPVKFARYPHVSSGKLVFAYHGDLWIANVDGSRPVRLTAHVSRNTFPRFSPDGKWVAFTSNRMGNDDVWVIPAAGGEARQLTFLSTGDTVLYWTPDGKRIIFTSNRSGRTFGSPLYTVAVEGRPARAAADGRRQQRHDQAGRLDDRLQPHRRPLLAQGLQGQRLRRHLRPGPEDEGDHPADRHQPPGVPHEAPEPVPDVGRRRDDLLLLRARRHLQHLEDRRRRAASRRR